ncbi:MAG: GAF domain-containing protein [Elusimicrobiota bacterium]
MEKVLLEIAQSISSTLNLNEVLERILDESIKLVDCEAGSIFLIDSETKELNFKVVKGDKSAILKELNIKIKLNEGIVGIAVHTGRVVISNNVQDDPRFKKDIDWLTGFTTKSVIAVPMIIKGKTIGAIELINKKIGEFTNEDTEIISAVASQSAVAIENARLYEELYTLKEYMSDIFESMPGGFIAIDNHKRITAINPRASEILNIPKDLVGENLTTGFVRYPEIVELFKIALSKAEPQIRREMYLTVGNKHKIIGYSTLVIKNADSIIKGAGMVFQDITDIKNKH